MCGRYARIHDLATFIAPLGIDDGRMDRSRLHDEGPRYNIVPGTNGWIARMDADGDVVLAEHKWSFPTQRGNRVNVRSETAGRVPEYRESFKRHRCVVLASGFYEPKGDKSAKNRPWFYFAPRDRAPLYLGGIVKPEGFSILTRRPVEPVASVHDRSPVLVSADNVVAWLDPYVAGRDALLQFAPPAFGETLEGWRVGDAAKRASNDGPELIEPIDGVRVDLFA